MGQGRAQRLGVRGLCQAPVLGHAQAFALNTMQALLEQGEVVTLAEQAQAAVEKFAQDGFLHGQSPQYGGRDDGLQG